MHSIPSYTLLVELKQYNSNPTCKVSSSNHESRPSVHTYKPLVVPSLFDPQHKFRNPTLKLKEKKKTKGTKKRKTVLPSVLQQLSTTISQQVKRWKHRLLPHFLDLGGRFRWWSLIVEGTKPTGPLLSISWWWGPRIGTRALRSEGYFTVGVCDHIPRLSMRFRMCT